MYLEPIFTRLLNLQSWANLILPNKVYVLSANMSLSSPTFQPMMTQNVICNFYKYNYRYPLIFNKFSFNKNNISRQMIILYYFIITFLSMCKQLLFNFFKFSNCGILIIYLCYSWMFNYSVSNINKNRRGWTVLIKTWKDSVINHCRFDLSLVNILNAFLDFSVWL